MTLTLGEAAARAGAHCWAERRLFELLGGWSAVVDSPAAALALDRHSQHAAWRAEQWWDRLPVLAQVDRDGLVAPGPGWSAGASGSRDDAAAGSAGVLAVAYRVLLPRLAVAYARHAAVTSPVADGPAVRTLVQVRADLASDWVEGETCLQDLLGDAAAVHAAARAVAAAELDFAG